MNHPNDDRLVLHAYGELAEAEAAETDAHLAACSTCRTQFAGLERSRVALGVAMPPARRQATRWVAAGLATAAVIAAVFFAAREPSRNGEQGWRGWRPPSVWSATAGYIAGGATVVEIDAQLTRLEQERHYGLPD